MKRELNISYSGPDSITEELNDKYIQAITFRLQRLVTISDNRQIDKTISKITHSAMQNVLQKFPGELCFTKEMMSLFQKELSVQTAPFIAHIHKKRSASSNKQYSLNDGC